MRRVYSFAACLTLVAALIVAPSTTSDALAQGPPVAGMTTIAFGSNPANLDGGPAADVTVTTTTTSTAGIVEIQKGVIQIQIATDGLGNAVAVGTPGLTWTPIPGQLQPDAGGQTVFNLDLDNLVDGASNPILVACNSLIGLRAHFVKQSSAVANHFSAGMDLATTCSVACEGLTIGAELASGDGCPMPPASGPWTFRITVRNCTGHDLVGVKVQGGTNGWAPMTGFLASSSTSITVKGNKKNQVLTWIVDVPNGEAETLDVTVDGAIKNGTPIGTVLFLSGPWSAVYDDDDDAATPPVKSDYTGRVSITVGPCE